MKNNKSREAEPEKTPLNSDDLEQVTGGRKNPGQSNTTIDNSEELSLDDLSGVSGGMIELSQPNDVFLHTVGRKNPGQNG